MNITDPNNQILDTRACGRMNSEDINLDNFLNESEINSLLGHVISFSIKGVHVII